MGNFRLVTYLRNFLLKVSRVPREQRFYTFILAAPTATAKIHRFQLPHHLLCVVCVLAALGALTVLAGAGWLIHKAIVFSEIATMQTQYHQLRHENTVLKSHYDELNQRINAIQDISKKISANGQLSISGGSGTHNGVGGPEMVKQLELNVNELESELQQLKVAYDREQLRLAHIPLGWPAEGRFTDDFGGRYNPFSGEGYEFHTGQDIGCDYGAPVSATGNGYVATASYQNGYGNLVVIDHGNGITTCYGHLSKIEVTVGQPVERGAIIGRAGSTGRSTGTHVHYEVRENDKPVDPRRYAQVGN